MRWNLALTYGLDAADAFLWHHQALTSEAFDDQHYWDLVTVIDLIPERRLRCRLRVRPRRLREDERRVVRAKVRVNGQPVVGERVRLRGAGVAESAKTSRRGTARATVEPRRPGKLRASVRGVKNLRGCKAAARVRG